MIWEFLNAKAKTIYCVISPATITIHNNTYLQVLTINNYSRIEYPGDCLTDKTRSMYDFILYYVVGIKVRRYYHKWVIQ